MLLVQGSVQLLTQRVRHESVPTLDAEAIDEELVGSAAAARLSADATTPGTAEAVGDGTSQTSSVPDVSAAPGVTVTGAATPTSLGAPLPPASAVTTQIPPAGAGGAVPTTSAPRAAPTTTTAVPPTTSPPGQTRTFTSDAGSIVIQCTGDSVQLVSYHPVAGTSARIDDWGPEEAEVRFLGPERTTRIKAVCERGVAEAEIQTEGPEDDD